MEGTNTERSTLSDWLSGAEWQQVRSETTPMHPTPRLKAHVCHPSHPVSYAQVLRERGCADVSSRSPSLLAELPGGGTFEQGLECSGKQKRQPPEETKKQGCAGAGRQHCIITSAAAARARGDWRFGSRGADMTRGVSLRRGPCLRNKLSLRAS